MLQGAVMIRRYRMSFHVLVVQINVPVVHRAEEACFYVRAPAAPSFGGNFCNTPIFQPRIVKAVWALQIMIFRIGRELEEMARHDVLHRFEIMPVKTMVPA